MHEVRIFTLTPSRHLWICSRSSAEEKLQDFKIKFENKCLWIYWIRKFVYSQKWVKQPPILAWPFVASKTSHTEAGWYLHHCKGYLLNQERSIRKVTQKNSKISVLNPQDYRTPFKPKYLCNWCGSIKCTYLNRANRTNTIKSIRTKESTEKPLIPKQFVMFVTRFIWCHRT